MSGPDAYFWTWVSLRKLEHVQLMLLVWMSCNQPTIGCRKGRLPPAACSTASDDVVL
jgi:hypothetical protein